MKIVVLDGYTENPFGEVTVYDRVSYVDSPVIAEKLGDAEVAVVNKTPITKATMDACPNLKAVAVLATGYNVVDTAYAKEKGIVVMNVPTYGTQIVGQYAVGLLLEICAHYGHHDRTVKEGRWQNNIDWCYWDYPMIELAGLVLLGLSDDRARGQDSRRDRTWTDRTDIGQNIGRTWYARHSL